jgi:hypothetical protein
LDICHLIAFGTHFGKHSMFCPFLLWCSCGFCPVSRSYAGGDVLARQCGGIDPYLNPSLVIKRTRR